MSFFSVFDAGWDSGSQLSLYETEHRKILKQFQLKKFNKLEYFCEHTRTHTRFRLYFSLFIIVYTVVLMFLSSPAHFPPSLKEGKTLIRVNISTCSIHLPGTVPLESSAPPLPCSGAKDNTPATILFIFCRIERAKRAFGHKVFRVCYLLLQIIKTLIWDMSRDQSAKRNKGAAQLATTEKLQRNMWFSPLCQVMLNPNQLKYF